MLGFVVYGSSFGMLFCSIGMQAFYAGLAYLPREICHAFPLRHVSVSGK